MSRQPAYEICKGDTFEYCGQEYTALEDPSGEFNTTIRVLQHSRGQETVLYIRDGDTVTLQEAGQ